MSVLTQVRKQLMISGASEHELLADSGGIQAMFQQIQALKREMNEAKKAAAALAEVPYLESIAEIEKRYAMMMKLSAR